MVPVEHAELLTRDMEVITELVSRTHAEHQALTRPIAGADPDPNIRRFTAYYRRAYGTVPSQTLYK